MEQVTFIQARPRGMKCDNPQCDWKDIFVVYEDFENWVNKPCPKCGANLMTEDCYERVKKAVENMEALNILLNRVAPNWMKKRAMRKGIVSIHANVDENGRIQGIDK